MKVNGSKDLKRPSVPPGRIKISKAMISLLKKKSFDAITWVEIAETAGVNEALIYKYFKDKRNLMHDVLQEYNSDFIKILRQHLQDSEGTFEKIRAFILSTLNYYHDTPVFAKILIVEIRNFPAFFKSETYEQLREYSNLLLEIIEEGIERGDIRADISPRYARQMIYGAIEHMCLPKVIFGTEVMPELYTDEICKFVFNGIKQRTGPDNGKCIPMDA
ncbi:MAG: Fatty acid metabolism regulator protein [Syntrophus sp. SKADARSKE-3]|nr:Fatty acid metabolism regulator protein [Syntrophus sp. SKADARSKE-3]